MLVNIKNPSLIAFTFLNPPILDLSKEGIHLYLRFDFFALIGNSTHNLKSPDFNLRDKIEEKLNKHDIEFRRGLSGGGSQIRQPYIEKYVKNFNIKINGVYKAPDPLDYPEADHCHHFGWYIGNYPELGESKINYITEILNEN